MYMYAHKECLILLWTIYMYKVVLKSQVAQCSHNTIVVVLLFYTQKYNHVHNIIVQYSVLLLYT